MDWYFEAFKKYAVFGGRSRRMEYWSFVLFNFVVFVVLAAIDALLGTFSSASGLGLLSGSYVLATLVPIVALSVRRLHDTDRSGWWILMYLIPLIGPIVLLVFALLDGTPGDSYERRRVAEAIFKRDLGMALTKADENWIAYSVYGTAPGCHHP